MTNRSALRTSYISSMHKKILIVIDDDALAEAVVAEGLALAKAFNADVFFFYFIPTIITAQGAAKKLSQEELQFREKERAAAMLATCATSASDSGIRSNGEMMVGVDAAACVEIVADAESCDMVVVGSYGRTTIQRFIYGSLPADLLPLLPMPMVVCKAPSLPIAAPD